jgi:hypothetical protein
MTCDKPRLVPSSITQDASSTTAVTRQPPKRQNALQRPQTHLTGYVVVHTHRLAPYGDIVGNRIPTSKAAAVKMAVLLAIDPRTSLIDSPEQDAIEDHIKYERYEAALATWCDYQQRRATEYRSSEDGDLPERIDILELPIDLAE